MADPQDVDSFILQVAPTYADAAAPSAAFLWEVPGGYEGRLLTVYYTLNYAAAREVDRPSFVEVVAQTGDILGRWEAPQMDRRALMDSFDASGVSLAMQAGVTVTDLNTVDVFTPLQYGSLPPVFMPESTIFNLIMDTDDNSDFLSDVMTLVEGRRSEDTALADIVPPYTTESFDLQRDQASAVAA